MRRQRGGKALAARRQGVGSRRRRVATRHGVKAELAVLDELAGGAWELATVDQFTVLPRTSH
ncbi:hypothetical protein [Bounagaea algeriensis]